MTQASDSTFDLKRAAIRVLLFQALALLGLWLLQSCFGTA
jgi:hypothetical protein